MKIAILGYSGSGKSTLAAYLGKQYQLPVLYLDTIQFTANWKEREQEEAKRMVAQFMEQDSWVIDGNYSSFLQKERLEHADQTIYLEFSRISCLLRVMRRYLKNRNRCRESMADGCIEKLDLEFIWWVLYKGRTKKKRAYYRNSLERYAEKTTIIKNQRQLDSFKQK